MFKKFRFIILSFFVFLLVLPAAVNAIELRGGEDLDYSSDKIFHGNTFIAGSNINFEAVVEGDLFIIGSEVDLDGAKILGDLYIGAGYVTLKDIEVEDVRLGSGDLSIQGSKISGDLMVGSGQVTIDKNTKISGSIYVGTGVFNLEGIVEENLRIGAGRVVIDAQIGGEVKVNADSLNIKKNSQINGKVIYRYSKEGEKAKIAQEAELLGGFSQKQKTVATKSQNFWSINLSSFFFSLIMYLVLGLLIVLLAPRCVRKAANILQTKPWSTLGWGVLGLFVLPIILFIIFATIIGISIFLIGFGVYFLLIYLAKIFVGIWLGIKLLKSEKKNHVPIWEMTLGVIILSILGVIPIIGSWITFLILLFGIGMILLQSYKLILELKNKQMI